MNKLSALLMALMISVIWAPPAQAADITDGLTFSGFVDTSYYNNSRDETSTFSLDQAELDIEKVIEDAGGLRIDINYLNGQDSTTDNILEQGYVWVNLGENSKLTFGKFNAPIGWELLDPNDMYQFSHAMVFDYGLPSNLTGAMISGASGQVDYAFYIANGWDLISDDNKDKTVGTRIGLTPAEGYNIGVSYITGKEGVDTNGSTAMNLSVIDIDFTMTAVENLTVGAEYNMGTHEAMSGVKAGADAEWTGWMVMANYAVSDNIAVTVRYDEFDDKDGSRFGSGVAEKRSAITISPSYAIADGFGALFEYRYTKSDQDVFSNANGGMAKDIVECALEFTYTF